MAPAAALPRGASAFWGVAVRLAARERVAAGARRATRLAAQASLTYRESASGIEFPLVQRLWLGEDMRCVGASCRHAKAGLWVVGSCRAAALARASATCLPAPTCLPARRSKKVAFIGVKVYAVALYVEAEKMARELGVRNRCSPGPWRLRRRCEGRARCRPRARANIPPALSPAALPPQGRLL